MIGIKRGACIGLDLDNTLIDYGDLFYRAACSRGLLAGDAPRDKTAVRDSVRLLPDGELHWQRIQAEVYGPGLAAARPYPGAEKFLDAAAQAGLRLAVVSHKTRFAAQDTQGTDLHEAARCWLRTQGFLGPGKPLAEDAVFFEATRADKTARIAALGCAAFVDDLPEVFAHPGFPSGTVRLLFAPEGAQGAEGACTVLPGWTAVGQLLLGDRHD